MNSKDAHIHSDFILRILELEEDARKLGLYIFLKPLNACKNAMGDNLASALCLNDTLTHHSKIEIRTCDCRCDFLPKMIEIAMKGKPCFYLKCDNCGDTSNLDKGQSKNSAITAWNNRDFYED